MVSFGWKTLCGPALGIKKVFSLVHVVLLLQKPIQETPICLCLELVSADVQ